MGVFVQTRRESQADAWQCDVSKICFNEMHDYQNQSNEIYVNVVFFLFYFILWLQGSVCASLFVSWSFIEKVRITSYQQP